MPIQSCGQSVSAQRGKPYSEIGPLTSYDVASDGWPAVPTGEMEQPPDLSKEEIKVGRCRLNL